MAYNAIACRADSGARQSCLLARAGFGSSDRAAGCGQGSPDRTKQVPLPGQGVYVALDNGETFYAPRRHLVQARDNYEAPDSGIHRRASDAHPRRETGLIRGRRR